MPSRAVKLAELVTDHVLAYEHRDVLAAVVDGNGEADHLRHHHRAARPGLDRLAVALGGGRLDFLQQVKIDERAFFE